MKRGLLRFLCCLPVILAMAIGGLEARRGRGHRGGGRGRISRSMRSRGRSLGRLRSSSRRGLRGHRGIRTGRGRRFSARGHRGIRTGGRRRHYSRGRSYFRPRRHWRRSSHRHRRRPFRGRRRSFRRHRGFGRFGFYSYPYLWSYGYPYYGSYGYGYNYPYYYTSFYNPYWYFWGPYGLFGWLPYYDRPVKETTILKQVKGYKAKKVTKKYVEAIFRLELVQQALRDLEGKTDTEVRGTIEQLRSAKDSLERELQLLGEKMQELRSKGKDVRRYLDRERDSIVSDLKEAREDASDLDERIAKRKEKGKDISRYENDQRDLKAQQQGLQLRRRIVQRLLQQFG